ncbi:MAG TPA: glycosyltransferase family 4 protein [Verrucomicrobiae bacterium]|nr:glycosyltransferase family 4 protein [Verrucomicrobiae bacterium]
MRFVFTVGGWYLGGFVTFCRNLSTGLRNSGHQVALLILPEANPGRPPATEVFDQCVIVPRGISRLISHLDKVVKAMDQLAPEILVINDSPFAMAALPFMHRDVLRIPVIHNTTPEEMKLGLMSPQWWDRALAVSPHVGRAAAAQGFGDRLSICPLGVPIPARTDRRLSAPSRIGRIRLISVSRVVIEQKRMDRVPAIAASLRKQNLDFHWTVLGSGDYLPKLERELERLNLRDHVSLRGSVPNQEVAEALQTADVFIMPSDYEGLPQALLEAMANGVVPVVSRIEGATTCAVTHGISGFLCEPSETEDFARAVMMLAAGPARRREMSEEAAAAVRKEFSLEAFTARFLEIAAQLRGRQFQRASALPLSSLHCHPNQFRCLGFWRNARHQLLGRLKHRWLARNLKSSCPEGALEPTLG